MRPVLAMSAVSKSIGGTPILRDIDLSLYPGEFHLLVGENGAGKSTLINILCGLTPKDKGTILIDGVPVQINSPTDAINDGIESIQQETYLFDSMTVAENVFSKHMELCRDKFGFVNISRMNTKTQELIDRLGFRLKSTQHVGKLNLAQKRMVEFVRLSILRPKILILDEPLSSMGTAEAEVLLNLIEEYRKQGTAVLYVCQHVKEISSHADSITVMRDGKIIETRSISDLPLSEMDKMIWGKYYPEKYPKLDVAKGPEIFCVENLCQGNLLRDISFSIAQGEILGITGLVGSGRSNLAKTIFGLLPKRSGTFYVDRLKAVIKSPKDAISLGLAYVTEDRIKDGLFLNLNILQNAFAIENVNSRIIIPSSRRDMQIYKKYEKRINLKPQDPEKNMFALSGGTQQKVMLMRWFLSSARIFIFDEPTRGVDIPSKVDIYNLMNDLVRKKGAIILISSSIEELVGMCDRILVLSEGRITYEANRKNRGEFDKIFEHMS